MRFPTTFRRCSAPPGTATLVRRAFYPALQSLLETAALAHGKTGVQVTMLPKPTEAGNPDFRVWDGQSRIMGYVEAKTPGANLDQVETSDQLKRYIHTFPNVILTDFYEFRLYRDGTRIARVTAGFAFSAGRREKTILRSNRRVS